ncbi:MAG: TRAP transporter small permease subunit [Desulfofustis sp.]|nr:TRAP transporter small permease subunit [Desulfofustis sp.]
MSEIQEAVVGVGENALDRWVIKVGNVVMWLYVAAVLISFYEVIMRYFFDSPTVWVHETTIAIVGMSMAYGGIYCYSTDSHIRVNLFTDLFPDRVQKILAIIVDTLTLVFSIGGGYAMYYMATRAVINPAGGFYMQRSGSAMNSVWPTITKLFILLVFICLVAQAFLHLLKKIRTFRKGE